MTVTRFPPQAVHQKINHAISQFFCLWFLIDVQSMSVIPHHIEVESDIQSAPNSEDSQLDR